MASNSGSAGRRGRGGGGGGRRAREDSPDVKLSKFLSFVCRHKAHDLGLSVQEGGWVVVSDILSLPRGRGFTEEDVRRVVAENEKQRFALQEKGDNLLIRANQGHSMEVNGLELRPIQKADEVACVVHGTRLQAWNQIRYQGLSRMQRSHIHFAQGLPGDSGVISGMRASSQVHIFIDLEKALADGYKFFLSANGVVLCPGNELGLLPPHYFTRVVETSSGKCLS